ncbi:MAG: type II toxin-antitoxin system VapB family antitoxin [Alphaproteobacteria bacterium]|nr:type II toxin-antitoxin system VapB family antitoxin [Alphaproteobacteria bacterium]
MRTTITLDDELLKEARELTELRDNAKIVEAGLRALIARELARRLAMLGGSQKGLKPIPRRRS